MGKRKEQKPWDKGEERRQAAKHTYTPSISAFVCVCGEPPYAKVHQ